MLRISIIIIITFLLFNSGCSNQESKKGPDNLSKQDIENLAVLGKVWGFLKYYHPVVATGKYDWDKTLIRLIPQVLEAENADQRNTILLNLVDTLGKFEINTRQDTLIKGEIKMLPDLNWINNSSLGSKLTKQLTNIIKANRTEENHYVSMVEGVGNPEFKKENGFIEMRFPNMEYRLLCLFRYWNIIQYYFPYKYLIEKNWNDVLLEYIPKFLSVSNEIEYKKCALNLTTQIHDSHAFFKEYNSTALQEYEGINYAPIEITFIENQAVITGYYDKSLGKNTGLEIGDVVNRVNNKSIKEIIESKRPFTPASNFAVQLRDIAFNLLRTKDTILKISFDRKGIKKEVFAKCVPQINFKEYYSYIYPDTGFKFINDEIAYIYPALFKTWYLPKFMAKISSTKGLIIDFRCYPSEPILHSLTDYLISDSIAFFKHSKPSIVTPGTFVMEKPHTFQVDINKHTYFYKGKVIILVNEQTQSAAEFTIMAWELAPRAIVIGSNTAGADGNLSTFMLPGGIGSSISGIGIYYPDGSETQRVGITVDQTVKPTVKGVREGRDELLERAIEIINGE